jgi:hypothetical protein
MQTTKLFIAGVIVVAYGVACGESNESPADSSTATTSDIANYQQLAVNVQSGATTYRANTTALDTATAADCRRVHDAYDADLRSWLPQMVQMSGAMDRYMGHHGGSSTADHACVAATMTYELERHHAAACMAADMGANRTEAGRHVDAMLSYGEHILERCKQMMRAIDAGNPSWGPMMHGCEDWDGCCSSMMHDGCCGGMMGGMHRPCCGS